jgi:hypothetical protein
MSQDSCNAPFKELRAREFPAETQRRHVYDRLGRAEANENYHIFWKYFPATCWSNLSLADILCKWLLWEAE